MYTYNGFPRAHWLGDAKLTLNARTEKHNILIMDRLGDSLEGLYTTCDRKFGVKTVCMIGIQIVNRIQSLHNEGYLHRDIKPDNFLIGSGDRHGKDGSVIHMIDMGLAKSYRVSGSGEHIPMRNGKRLTGTPRYASINTHNGLEQSRRDDLESLCYILIYFLRGRLPWQGMHGSTKAEKYDQIRKKKVETSPEKLCENLPEEFINFLNYVRKLEFTQEPDYKFLKKLLQLCCQRVEARKIDWRFAWQNPEDNSETVRKKPDKPDKPDAKKNEEGDSVQCLSRPPNKIKIQQQPQVVSERNRPHPAKRRENRDSSGPTTSEQNRKTMAKFGGDMQRALRAYHEIERERDELKKKCYEYEALNQKLKKDLEKARQKRPHLYHGGGRKRRDDHEHGHRQKRPRISGDHGKLLSFGQHVLGKDSLSPIQIE